jgi:putative membrane protein
MARRLWNIITVPAFVLMAIFGIWMFILNPSLQMSWFHVKILFLIGFSFIIIGAGKKF